MTTRIRAALVALLAALTVLAGASAASADSLGCDRAELCLWTGTAYRGTVSKLSLNDVNPGECVPLPDTADARSFANLLSRAAILYQGRECSTEGEFDTYPGDGTYVPESPFVVRAVQIWPT